MITSFANPLVKRIKRLRQRQHRQAEGVFFAEGLRVVLTAVERGAPVELLVYAPELLTSEVARQAVARQQALGAPCYALDAAVFKSLSLRDNPAGLGAIVKMAWRALEDAPVAPDNLFVALDGAADPGNLGTILRTMDAAAAAGLILAGQGTDPYHPTAVRASMGMLFTVPLFQVAHLDEALVWARVNGLQTVATSTSVSRLYSDAPYRLPGLLLVGGERQGLERAVLEAADLAVAIPMRGSASSLNVAVATGLLLYEWRRRPLPSPADTAADE